MFRYDVLCIGSGTLDNFLTSEEPLSKVKLGDKVLVKSLEKHSGGGATNAGAALARMGLQVKILTKLGNDHDADFIIKELKEYRIKNICRNSSRKNTDFSMIVSSAKEKDRIIYVYKGASKDLSLGDFRKYQLKARWIYLATLMGKSYKTAEAIAEYAKIKKINLLFNPSLYLAKKGINSLKRVLEATAILVLNDEEARALLGRNAGASPKQLLFGLNKTGPKIVVITNGSKRIYALYEKNVYSLLPPKVKVVHTAGAGDAFTSGLLAGLIKGFSVKEALSLGQANANSVIQRIGTKNGLLGWQEAVQGMKRCRVIEHGR